MKGLSVAVTILLLLAADKLSGVLRQAGALPRSAYETPVTILESPDSASSNRLSAAFPSRL